MSDAKDPAVKLFGKTIQLLEIQARSEDSIGAVTNSSSGAAVLNEDNDANHASTAHSSADECHTRTNGGYPDVDNDFGGKTIESKIEHGGPTTSSEDIMNPDVGSSIENPNASSYEETSALKSSKTPEEQKEMNNSRDKTSKKPDKILPCPRCTSMETKFCYYNNYNVNQPRHFCKNCQRYWTAGGTMRNVPVGAGRRKNKSAASLYHQMTVSEAFQNPRTDIPNGNAVQNPPSEANAMVFTFGSDAPLRETVVSVLDLSDKSTQDCIRKGFHRPEELRSPVSYSCEENVNDQLGKPSEAKDDAKNTMSQEQVSLSLLPQIPFFTAAPWPFPWNLSQWSPPAASPTLIPPVFTVPLYPAAAYWDCVAAGAWNVPLLISQQSSPKDTASYSPTLGKHSREENVSKSNNSEGLDEHIIEKIEEKNLWVPKTLRVDDPRDAAKSSIWRTLGIKNDLTDSVRGVQFFKALSSKDGEKIHSRGTSPVLQANPAALSRSLNFRESSI